MYRSTKHYGHEVGLSACFRQWRAASHCRLLHGYALAFTFVFEASTLDENGWVVDFGALGELKTKLKQTFDHRLLVAADDPDLGFVARLHEQKLADVLVLDHGVGCEAFAKFGWHYADAIVGTDRVRVVSCEVREHGANSAIYLGVST